jgi:hypothetical protein
MGVQVSLIILLCGADLTVGTTVTLLKKLNAMGIIGPQGGRGQVLNHQKQGDCRHHNRKQKPSSKRVVQFV